MIQAIYNFLCTDIAALMITAVNNNKIVLNRFPIWIIDASGQKIIKCSKALNVASLTDIGLLNCGFLSMPRLVIINDV